MFINYVHDYFVYHIYIKIKKIKIKNHLTVKEKILQE